jgi:hypothetical protein
MTTPNDPSVKWRPGDRVRLSPTGRPADATRGTVREVTTNAAGMPGVVVDLDTPVRGETWCSASPSELVRIKP